jgi:hypothetical protein
MLPGGLCNPAPMGTMTTPDSSYAWRRKGEHVSDCRRNARNPSRMCNDFRFKVETAAIGDALAKTKIPLRFPRGMPNLQRYDIRIADIYSCRTRPPPSQIELNRCSDAGASRT